MVKGSRQLQAADQYVDEIGAVRGLEAAIRQRVDECDTVELGIVGANEDSGNRARNEDPSPSASEIQRSLVGPEFLLAALKSEFFNRIGRSETPALPMRPTTPSYKGSSSANGRCDPSSRRLAPRGSGLDATHSSRPRVKIGRREADLACRASTDRGGASRHGRAAPVPRPRSTSQRAELSVLCHWPSVNPALCKRFAYSTKRYAGIATKPKWMCLSRMIAAARQELPSACCHAIHAPPTFIETSMASSSWTKSNSLMSMWTALLRSRHASARSALGRYACGDPTG